MEYQYRVAQKVFIQDDGGKLLVVRFSANPSLPTEIRGLWDIPGGGLENESLRDGLVREMLEELGDVQIEVGAPFTTWTFPMERTRKTCVVIGYKARWVRGTIMLNEEHDMFRWISKKDIRAFTFAGEEEAAAVRHFFGENT